MRAEPRPQSVVFWLAGAVIGGICAGGIILILAVFIARWNAQ